MLTGTLIAFGLYLVRTSALVLAAPILGNAAPYAAYKVALIVALAAVLYGATGAPLAGDVGALAFGAMAMRELLIGFALALVLQLVALAVRVAGELVGHEMAFNMSSIVDPATGVSTPLITHLYEGLFLLGLLAVDGHHVLIRALSDSFERAPVGALGLAGSTTEAIGHLFAQMFAAGLTFAAPVLVLLLVVSLLIGLLARAVPQLNVLDLGFTLRIVVGLLALYAFAPLLAPALSDLYASFDAGLDGVMETLAP